jgi:putative acetyltransferase
MFRIAIEPPDQPEIIALVDALDAYQKPLYPAESHHGIDLDALRAPGVLFAVARDSAGQACGCAAVVLRHDYGELKRMYVPPEARGRGLGAALLEFLEQQAIANRRPVLRLETGNRQPEALRLYARAGYRERDPFGDYRPDPNSVFMEKSLCAARGHS